MGTTEIVMFCIAVFFSLLAVFVGLRKKPTTFKPSDPPKQPDMDRTQDF